MARIWIVSDDRRTGIEVRAVEELGEVVIDGHEAETGWAVGWCSHCNEWLTDRGHFEDTCNEIANHIDRLH